ncbi:MAG: tRNA modification GTPase [Flavobacteriales bacterium]|jgi:tRNA modification GTPase
MLNFLEKDTICAISTAPGVGGIAVIRVSGHQCFELINHSFKKNLAVVESHTVHFGHFYGDNKQLIDEVVIAVFKGPNSFTGEDVAEISCHGSSFIQQEILTRLMSSGCRLAEPGEYTMRAFMNKRMDLVQAEAVADLIAASSAKSHEIAMQQMRGGFSKEISELRQQLINFASLIELELDFSEEDVEFADRTQLQSLINLLHKSVSRLVDSFRVGNVLKNGIPVAIIGAPNVGKSTLLNALLNEERAIVSEIAGTTRDTVEDEIILAGTSFRFIDTAGIRATQDTIESIGIGRSYEKAKIASVVLLLFDLKNDSLDFITEKIADFKVVLNQPDKKLILLFNKVDAAQPEILAACQNNWQDGIYISAKQKDISPLTNALTEFVTKGLLSETENVVSNARHHEALLKTLNALNDVNTAMESKISGDFLAIDIRQALHYLGTITGEITTDDLLGNIFSKFCIGK